MASSKPLLDPRQQAMWSAYIDPHSETFSNAYQSAIKAGYTHETSKQITVSPWFLGMARRMDMRQKAEKVLDEMVDMDTKNVMVHNGELVTRNDPALLKIKQDTAKFVAERLGKDHWAIRQELTGAEGGPIVDEKKKENSESLIRRFLSGGA